MIAYCINVQRFPAEVVHVSWGQHCASADCHWCVWKCHRRSWYVRHWEIWSAFIVLMLLPFLVQVW